MSSYHENLSTKENYWNNLYKKGTNILKVKLREKLNNLFRIYNIVIPESKYIKFYYWRSGVAESKKDSLTAMLVLKAVMYVLYASVSINTEKLDPSKSKSEKFEFERR